MAPRRAYLKKKDFENCGYTTKCLGCKALLKGTRAVGHSEECRKRMEKELEGTDKIEKAKARGNQFCEEVLDREDRKRRRGQNGDKKSEEETAEMREADREETRSPLATEAATTVEGGGQASGLMMDEETRKRSLE